MTSFSTYLGGSGRDEVKDVALDAAGNLYLVVSTTSADLPGTTRLGSGGNNDIFLAKVRPNGSALIYATYLGGRFDDRPEAIAVDAAGNVWIVGSTSSDNFPLMTPRQPSIASHTDGFVAVLDATGTNLLFSTFLGGSGQETIKDIALDSAGNAYVCGWTPSTDFPLMNPLQSLFGGSSSEHLDLNGWPPVSGDAFVAKFRLTGELVYSTFVGGAADDAAWGIAVDTAGSAVITGTTTSTNFPTASALYPTLNATNPGPRGSFDAFVAKLSPDGLSLLFSTYLGSTAFDLGVAVALTPSGDVFVAGNTDSGSFPTTNAIYGAARAGSPSSFVAKLQGDGSQALYSTYLTGQSGVQARTLATDARGDVYVGGFAYFLPLPDGAQPLSGSAFIAKLDRDLAELIYSTQFGGQVGDTVLGLAIDAEGNIFAGGYTDSPTFPTVNAFQSTNTGHEGFLIKLAPAADSTPPQVVATQLSQRDGLNLIFSEPLLRGSVTNLANYALNHGASVTGAELIRDTRTVRLSMTPLDSALTYTLTLNNLQDRARPPNAIAPNTQLVFHKLPDEQPARTTVTQSNFYRVPGLYIGVTAQQENVLLYPPRGAYVEAKALRGVSSEDIVPDDNAPMRNYYPLWNTTVSGAAARLREGGARIPLRFENLLAGVYFVRVVGRVNQQSIPRIRPPLYLHLSVNDGSNGETNEYRMLVNYAETLEETGRIFFNALKPTNTLDAELFVGHGSQADLLVHRLEFYDALAGTDRRAYKTSGNTFTLAERDAARRNAAEIATHDGNERDPSNPDPVYNTYAYNPVWQWSRNDPYLPTNLVGQARIARDDHLWNSLPPINSMYFFYGSAGLFDPPANPDGAWEIYPCKYAQCYDYEFTLTNATLQTNYTLADFRTHKPLPGAYGDDGLGWWVPGAGQSFNSPGSYYFIVGRRVFERINDQFYAALGSRNFGQYNSSLRYHMTGNTNVAHEAALMLARLALQWPAMQMEVQELGLNAASPELTFGGDGRWGAGWLTGKLSFPGQADSFFQDIAKAYDLLFPFLDDNQDFADTLHRYIPWIQTPADVIAFFDIYLLQVGMTDSRIGRVQLTNPILIGLVQGDSPAARDLMDISKAAVNIYPVGTRSLKSHYRNSFSQDGTMFIGSHFYVQGESTPFLTAADAIARFKTTGATVRYDLTDLSNYPKVRAFGEFLMDSTVAGGFEVSFGDASRTIYAPRDFFPTVSEQARTVWRVTQNPKAAWLVQHAFGGRSGETDAEWTALTNAAAAVRDPRLSSASRVFAGLGLGILESGVESDDYRRKRAVVLRTATGAGHAHHDALDLNFYALGLRMANDFAQRNEGNNFTVPPDNASFTHNVVEVDGYMHHTRAEGGWPGGSFSLADAWIEAFQPNRDVQFIAGAGASLAHTNVDVFRRDVALIDIDAANSYVFDVFRVRGGKMHTWCFHGADSGMEEGGFTVNTPLAPPVSGSYSATYLRKHADASTREGVASDKLEATWRVSRTSATTNLNNADGAALTVSTVAAEQNMLQSGYDPAALRKFAKVTLFDRANDVVMSGNLYSAAYSINEPILYVQSRPDGTEYGEQPDKENVYPALIEAFAGQTAITNSIALPIANNDTDALKAVVLRVSTTAGRTDWLFSDGRNIRRDVDEGFMQVNGRFACYSEQSNAFHLLNLMGGTELTRGGIFVRLDTNVHRATIQSVDFAARRIHTVERLLANGLAGRQFHIYNDHHHCSYKVDAVADAGSGSALTFHNPADIGEFAVKSVNGDTIVSDDVLALDYVANRHRGLTAVNELRTKFWKIEKISGLTAYENVIYRVTGDSVAEADFTDEDGDGRRSVIVYDFGPGDTLELPTSVWLKNNDTTSTRYTLRANVAVTLSLTGVGIMELQGPDSSWRNITVGTNGGALIGQVNENLITGLDQQLRVSAHPVGLLAAPISTTVLEGRQANFSVAVHGSPQYGFQWFANGVPIASATNDSLTLAPARADSGMTIYVVVSNALNIVTSSPPAVLTVIPDDIPPQILAAESADGTMITIRFSEELRRSTAESMAKYRVNGGSVVVQSARLDADAALVELTVSGLGGVPFTPFTLEVLGVEDLAGNPASDSVSCVVFGLTAVDIGVPGVDPLEPGSVSVDCTNTFVVQAGGSDIWNNADAFHFDYTMVTGDFDLRVRVESLLPRNRWSQAGVMIREHLTPDSRHLATTITPGDVPTPDGSGNGANQYGAFYRPMTGGPSEYWPPARPKPGVPYPNAWIRLIRAGDVFTAWHGTNGTGWDQFAQATADLPASSFVGAATLGHNNSPGNRTTAVYHDFLLMVTPRIVIPPTSLVVTQGSPASLSVTATGGGLTYQWLSNAVALARATNAMLYFSNVQPAHMATYSVRVSNTVGTATSPPVSLTVLVSATIVSQPANQTVSCGDAVTMSVTAGGTPPLSYQWRLEGENVGQATNANLRFSPARLADTGAYSVVISNVVGAVTSAPVMLSVVDNLAPQIFCPPSLVVPCDGAGGTHVSFAVSATDNCDSNLVVLCEPSSGAIFPTGTTLVSCRAVDASANTNFCAFTVTVEEPAPLRLAIDLQGTTLLLSWPESCSDHVLEETGDLTDHGSWRRIDPPSIRDRGRYRATILVTNQMRFLRLRRVIP